MFWLLSVIIIAMFVGNPVMQTEALIGGILFCVSLQNRILIAEDIKFYLPMFLLIAVTNPLFSHNGVTPLFFMNGNPVTLEALVYGIFISVMVVGVMLWFKCYSFIMTTDKFLFLFGKAIPKLSLVLSMALRFIPLFKRQMKKVGAAQKALGFYSSKSFIDRIRGRMRVLNAMIAWSLENSIDTASSMKARGYGLKGRTNFSLFRFHLSDSILLSVNILLLAATLAGIFTGGTDFAFYPRITPIRFTFSATASYVSFGLLCLIPFILEREEKTVWKYYRSKI